VRRLVCLSVAIATLLIISNTGRAQTFAPSKLSLAGREQAAKKDPIQVITKETPEVITKETPPQVIANEKPAVAVKQTPEVITNPPVSKKQTAEVIAKPAPPVAKKQVAEVITKPNSPVVQGKNVRTSPADCSLQFQGPEWQTGIGADHHALLSRSNRPSIGHDR